MKNFVITVFHEGYGCDTGCCGHRLKLTYTTVGHARESYEFGHMRAGDDPRRFAEGLIRKHFGDQHVADLDWDNSQVTSYDECDQ